jgi:hypothetical protein
VVTIGLPSGEVDLLPTGAAVEAVELSLDDKGQIVSSERRAVDLASVEPDPTILRLGNL